MTRVSALLTCFNRKELTLRCLDRLASQNADADLSVVVVDDASPDGTAAAIAERHPAVHVVHGTGDLFWVGGMRLAFAHASQQSPDHYLLLNDDTDLDPTALELLLSTADRLRSGRHWPAVVVGSTVDPETGSLTYGGVRRSRRSRPMSFQLVEPDPPGGEPQPCETMNGNCVLVPAEVVERIGFFDAHYTQSFADYDYGLRAWRAGCSVWMAPGSVGTCPRNPPPPRVPVLQELRRLTDLKDGLPFHEWGTFSRRWAGPLWPLYAVSPYVRRLGFRIVDR